MCDPLLRVRLSYCENAAIKSCCCAIKVKHCTEPFPWTQRHSFDFAPVQSLPANIFNPGTSTAESDNVLREKILSGVYQTDDNFAAPIAQSYQVARCASMSRHVWQKWWHNSHENSTNAQYILLTYLKSSWFQYGVWKSHWSYWVKWYWENYFCKGNFRTWEDKRGENMGISKQTTLTSCWQYLLSPPIASTRIIRTHQNPTYPSQNKHSEMKMLLRLLKPT